MVPKALSYFLIPLTLIAMILAGCSSSDDKDKDAGPDGSSEDGKNTDPDDSTSDSTDDTSEQTDGTGSEASSSEDTSQETTTPTTDPEDGTGSGQDATDVPDTSGSSDSSATDSNATDVPDMDGGDPDGGADDSGVDTDTTPPLDCNYDGQVYSATLNSRVITEDVLTSCNYEGSILPTYYATVSNDIYAASSICGRCISVSNATNGETIEAMVVDRCPDGSGESCAATANDLALDSDAALILGLEPDAGVPTTVDWHYVPCEGDSFNTIKYRFHNDVNDHWFAIQIRDHRNAIGLVEIEAGNGWQAAERRDWNYWVLESCCGAGPFDIRVTDIYGNVLTSSGIALSAGTIIDGPGQFPECAGSQVNTDPTGPFDTDISNLDSCYDGAAQTGTGTVSAPVDGTDHCNYGNFNISLPGVTVSRDIYSGSEACGRCVEIINTATGNHVTAIVDNQCGPDTGDACAVTASDLGLSTEAMAALGGTEDTAPITWYNIPCEGAEFGTISYIFEGGSNPNWFAVQVRNHRNPLSTVEVRTDGDWVQTQRQGWNYWLVPEGMGDGPFDFRVTDIFGHVLTDDDVPESKDQAYAGSGQFPVCAK